VPQPAEDDMKKNVLLGEPKYLMVDKVPMPAKT
jgi:hypothetical protein